MTSTSCATASARWTRSAARTANHAGHEGIEDLATVSLSFASGLEAHLTSVWHDILSRGSTRRVEVFCREGMVWLDDEFRGPLHVQTSDGTEVRPCPSPEWVDALPLADDEVGLAVRTYVEADRAFVDAVTAGCRSSAGPRRRALGPPPGRRGLPLGGRRGSTRLAALGAAQGPVQRMKSPGATLILRSDVRDPKGQPTRDDRVRRRHPGAGGRGVTMARGGVPAASIATTRTDDTDRRRPHTRARTAPGVQPAAACRQGARGHRARSG